MNSIGNLQIAFKKYVKIKRGDTETVPQNFWVQIAEYWQETEGNENVTNDNVRKRFHRRFKKLERANFSQEVLEDILDDLAKDDRTYFGELDSDEGEYFREEDESHEERNETRWDHENNTVSSKSERIKTLDQLLDVADVDLNIFEIEKEVVNAWEVTSWKKGYAEVRTNFQVKAWLKNKFFNKVDSEWVQGYFDEIANGLPTIDIPKVDRTGDPIVCAIADLHAGGFTENMKLVPDYNLATLEVKLQGIAQRLKRLNRPVHLKILGDLIESFTGKNHKDTWKQIEMHGVKVMFVVADMLQKMVSEAGNIVSIDIISGNHDRITSSNQEDVEGQVAFGVAELLKRSLPSEIEISFDPLIVSKKHGNVNYILLHGHLPIAKKNPSQIVLDYGDQNCYNVILTAHYHEELLKKNTTRLRLHQVPSLVPANNFAQNLGVHAPTGFVLFESNEFKSVDTQSLAV